MNTYQVQTTFAQGAKCARSAAFVGTVKGEGLRFAWKRPKLGRTDTAFRSRFVGRGYLYNDIFLPWFSSKHDREGQTGRRQGCRRVVIGREISLFIGAQYKDGIIDRSHISGRYKDLGDTGERSHAKFATNVIGRLRLRRQPDLSWR